MKTSLFLMTALTCLTIAGAASAEKITFVGAKNAEELQLTGENEIPAVNTAVTGEVILTFDTDTKKLCGKVTFQPSTFKGTAAHIHVGDDKEANGEVYVNLSGAFDGDIKVNETLDEEQVKKLTEGDSYVNVHTDTHTGGEIRGQLVADETAEAQTCETVGGGDDDDDDAGGSGSGGGDGGGGGNGRDAGASSSSGTAAAPEATDDGGCNTTGSGSGNALALLAGLGVVVAAASRKRKKS